MEHPVTRHALLERFTCLGDACPDTCCHGWSMPTDSRQRALYTERAPELLAAIDTQTRTMKRNAGTDYCVKLQGGMCGIHQAYGEHFLSDACYFYPRITRDFNGMSLMSASLSCPEIVRLALEEPHPFALQETTLNRLPITQPKPLPEGMSWERARAIMAAFMHLAQREDRSPETMMAQIIHASLRLNESPQRDWQADLSASASPEPLSLPSDPYALLYALGVLMMRGPATKRSRLETSIRAIEEHLDCTLDWENRDMRYGPNAGRAWNRLQARWNLQARTALAPSLRRWIQAQLASSAWPFAGFAGTTLAERTTVLAVRFATVRLALMARVELDGTPPTHETVIATIQGIARFMDHLADADLSRLIYRDAGWLNNESRLLGLVGV